jgi:MOSC domain-containing protein YiiM
MKLVSVNVGLPQNVVWHERTVTTGIFKNPVGGRVGLTKLNLDGDRQADLTVHGGEHKAVYLYPAEHYDYWKTELPGIQLPFGMFGENLTTEGLLEQSVHIGDELAVGSVRLTITQPRMPCYKLGLKFQSDEMIKRFLASGRSGFYALVSLEGEVGAEDEITITARDQHAVSISEITGLYVAKHFTEPDIATVRRALLVAALPESWKQYFRDRLEGVADPV